MNLLFICQHGEDRSPAAALVARELAEEKGLDISTRYLGLSSIGVDAAEEQLAWADVVYVMEPGMLTKIRREYGYTGTATSLDIPDAYSFWSKELRAILRRRLSEALGLDG